MTTKKTVLITGCSQGGLGDALARAFHSSGFRVLATARNPKKMAHLSDLGIETVVLDVQSKESLEAAVQQVAQLTGGSLDVLVNNSGVGYSMPIADADIARVRDVFDVNVFSVIAVTQAFLPLIRQASAGALVVNNTSIASILTMPMEGIYSATKAAAAKINDALRVELKPFGIQVIELKTGTVKSKFFDNTANNAATGAVKLPANSIYEAGRDIFEEKMTGQELMKDAMDADAWAAGVVADLTKSSPPAIIWRGTFAYTAWFVRKFLPHTSVDIIAAGKSGMSEFANRLRSQKKQS